jgi:small subunit ribosomal protein S20
MTQEAAAGSPQKKKKEGVVRRPTALKRDIQSEKRRVRNRSFRASVLTAIRSLESSIEKKEPKESALAKLNLIYSLMDKGVKKGVFKLNKASRTKARLTAKVR